MVTPDEEARSHRVNTLVNGKVSPAATLDLWKEARGILSRCVLRGLLLLVSSRK